MRFLFFIGIIIMGLLPCLLQAQDPYYVPINQSKGLPSNAVYSLLQDHEGFIWIAGDAGLVRYDGYEFKRYLAKNQSSLSGSHIKQDIYKRIWYTTFDGNLHYTQQDSLHLFSPRRRPFFYRCQVFTDSHLYVLHQDGIDVYNLADLHFIKTVPISIPAKDVAFLDVNAKYCYVVGQYKLIILEDTEIKKEIEIAEAVGLSFSLQQGEDLILVDKFNKNKKLYKYSHQQQKIIDFLNIPIDKHIQNLSYIDDSYWFSTTGGLYIYNTNEGKKNKNKLFFTNKNQACSLKDREGNIWLGTTNEGILFIPNLSDNFIATKGFSPNKILVHGAHIYIGDKNGKMLKMDTAFANTTYLEQDSTNHAVYKMYIDSSAQTLFYSDESFKIFDLNTGKSSAGVAWAVKDMQRVDTGYYAIAASGSFNLAWYLPKSAKYKDNIWTNIHRHFQDSFQAFPIFQKAIFLEGARCKAVAYLHDQKTIYFASNLGLYKLTPDSLQEIKYQNQTCNFINLLAYQNKIFALSSIGDLFLLQGDSLRNLHIGGLRGLKILDNFLFYNTAEGIFFADLRREGDLFFNKINKNITADLGEINDMALLKNKLLLAVNIGFLLLDFDNKTSPKTPPLFKINSLKVNNQRYFEHFPTALSPNQNHIEIHYSILSFKTNGQYPLYYKINDNEWKLSAPLSRTLELPNLPAGDYRVQFRLGLNGEIHSLQWHISLPITRQWWFLSLLAAAVLSLLFIYYKWQTNVLKKQNSLLKDKMKLEKELHQSMMASIKSQMNPHFFYNALNSLQAFIFMDDKQLASDYLTKFSMLTRMILEMSEQEKILLSEEIEALTLYLELEKVRFDDSFHYTIHLAPNLNLTKVKLPPMLIQPYVENALRHGLLHKIGNKKLDISFAQEGSFLKVCIEDNGVGRARAAEINRNKRKMHKSFSSQANLKRLTLLHFGSNEIGLTYTDKVDENGLAAGTLVVMSLPL